MQKVINILVFVCPWQEGPRTKDPAGLSVWWVELDCIFIIPGQQRTKRWGEPAKRTKAGKRSAVNSDALEFMQQILTYYTHTYIHT